MSEPKIRPIDRRRARVLVNSVLAAVWSSITPRSIKPSHRVAIEKDVARKLASFHVYDLEEQVRQATHQPVQSHLRHEKGGMLP